MREQVLVLHSLYTSAVFKELYFANVEFFFLGVPRMARAGRAIWTATPSAASLGHAETQAFRRNTRFACYSGGNQLR